MEGLGATTLRATASMPRNDVGGGRHKALVLDGSVSTGDLVADLRDQALLQQGRALARAVRHSGFDVNPIAVVPEASSKMMRPNQFLNFRDCHPWIDSLTHAG